MWTKKKILRSASAFIFCLSLVIMAVPAQKSHLNDIIYVDDSGGADYTTIHDAINAASDGDTIFIHSGYYKETLIIDKTLTLIGEEKKDTIIDGGGIDDVITIAAEGVQLSRCTIQNSSTDIRNGWWKAGIRIIASKAIIEENVIQQNLLGIFAKQVSDLTIRDNMFFDDSLTIYPYDTNYSSRPTLTREQYIHIIENNLVNDKPLLYYVDTKDILIPGDIGQLILVNCTQIRMHNASISSADFPVLFVFCHACRIENSTFFDNEGECTMLDSDENTICHNHFQNNFHGVLLDYRSESNHIHHNTFESNRFCGFICEYFSNENIISQNDFLDNEGKNAFFIRAFKNKWDRNFWNEQFNSSLPKIIIGTLFESYQFIPSWCNIDWNPRSEPFIC
jgi:parallel beta-helix repeat protein